MCRCGTSLVVEQQVSNLLVGVRFSRPAQKQRGGREAFDDHVFVVGRENRKAEAQGHTGEALWEGRARGGST